MARIRIITPGQLGSNPRVVKEATALADAGHEVSVVAIKMMAEVEPRDQDVLRAANWDIERLPFDRPRAWKVLRARQELARRLYGVTGLAPLETPAISPMTPQLAAAARARPADLYIAHYPPALPAAAAAARAHGAIYAYDAEDFHPGDLPDAPEHALDHRLIRAVEGRYLPGAAHVTAASPGIAYAYAETYGISRPVEILNTFPLAQAPEAPTPRGTARPGPSIYWFSQVIGPNRGLEAMVRATAIAATRPHLYLRGMVSHGFLDGLRRLAAEHGVADRLHVLEPALPQEMERLAAAYDIGLVAETGYSRSRQLCLTNKMFSFLLAGLPVLLSDTPAHRAFRREAGPCAAIYPVDDAAALASTIDSFLAHPDRLAAARFNAWRLGQERFNWDRESRALRDLVDATLARRRTYGRLSTH